MNDDEVLHQMRKLVTANTKTMSVLGAQIMVLRKFFDVTLPHLTTAQRFEVGESFRESIEDVMSMMDDVALPAEYHSALLDLTNSILTELGQKPARSG